MTEKILTKSLDKSSQYFKPINCPFCQSKRYQKMFFKINHHKWLYQINEKPLSFTIVKCTNCGLQYMNPILNKNGLKKVYTPEYMENWNLNRLTLKQQKVYKASFKRRMEYIIKKTKLKKGKILDYGCGNGNFIIYNHAKFKNWIFYGYDFNEKLIAKNNNIYYDRDITTTSIPKNYFDIIILIETIEHFTELDKEISKILEYLKEGGFIYIETGNQDSLIAKITGKNHFYYDIYHTIYFSIRMIKMLLKKKKLKLICIADYPINYDLIDTKMKFSITKLFKGFLIYSLGLIKINNFSITGGMSVIAQKGYNTILKSKKYLNNKNSNKTIRN